MAEYNLKLMTDNRNYSNKCGVHEFNNVRRSLNLGPLYTITSTGDGCKEERTYDEPYAGDLPRRSWLCCPGSQTAHVDNEIDLLEGSKTPTTPGDAIIKGPTYTICSNGCVRFLLCY